MTNPKGTQPPDFDWMSEYNRVEEMLVKGQSHQVGPYVRELTKKYCRSRYLHILLGMICTCMGSRTDALKSFETAVEMNTCEMLPPLNSSATRVYVELQMSFQGQDRPCNRQAKRDFQKNLTALRIKDTALTDELETTGNGLGLEFVDVWGQTHHIYAQNKQVVTILEDFSKVIAPWLNQWGPLAITNIISGQELPWLLTMQEQRREIALGRTRAIYVFDPDLTRIRIQLHLDDFSREIESNEVVFFAGHNSDKRVREFFSTLRYAPPITIAGDEKALSDDLGVIHEILDPREVKADAQGYYQSEEFARRLRGIAAGTTLPRILFSTCRWTTFLKHCAKDFERAFVGLGCETFFEIEQGDAESLLSKLTWKHLSEFKPDVVFGVSHARPSFDIPRELPVIAYIQDKCGAILNLSDLSDKITNNDLFVCMMRDFQKYLIGKNVSQEQTFVLPIPADETMFFPLPEAGPGDQRFVADVGFVKHADTFADQAFEHFSEIQFSHIQDESLRTILTTVFRKLYETMCRNDDQRNFEDEMQKFVWSRLRGHCQPEFEMVVKQLVTSFNIVVYANICRYQYLNALNRAGIQVGLFGNNWGTHPRFKRLARGPVSRNELNKAYNYNRINLNIHPCATMHQRVNECALAGGFMIGLSHPDDKDWEPVGTYFEPGKEIILVDTALELVEACQYYLAHPDQRKQMAEKARQRALEEQTISIAVKKILDKFRTVLGRAI